MISPYLRTGWLTAIARSATLCPDGVSAAVLTVMPAIVSSVPAAVSTPTTATSSVGWRRIGATAGVTVMRGRSAIRALVSSAPRPGPGG